MKTIFLTTVLAFTTVHSSYAASAVREKYSATENDGTAKVVDVRKPVDHELDQALDDIKPAKTATVPAPIAQTTAPASSTAPVAQTAPTPALEPVATAQTAASADSEEKFELVPIERIPEIAARMKYTYDILKRYGRAYDYRATTLKELKQALTDLETNDPRRVQQQQPKKKI